MICMIVMLVGMVICAGVSPATVRWVASTSRWHEATRHRCFKAPADVAWPCKSTTNKPLIVTVCHACLSPAPNHPSPPSLPPASPHPQLTHPLQNRSATQTPPSLQRYQTKSLPTPPPSHRWTSTSSPPPSPPSASRRRSCAPRCCAAWRRWRPRCSRSR